MNIIQSPSPNFDSRDGQQIDMLVLHYTGMRSAVEALERLRDPAAKVSAHYMVEEDGTVHQLVDESARAWHAGVSSWRGNTNINQRSIGIEIVNPGHEFGYRDFPDAQIKSVIALCKAILSRHDIPARNVVGHSDVAPARKQDPGEKFPWGELGKQGIGISPLDKPMFWKNFLVSLPSVMPGTFFIRGIFHYNSTTAPLAPYDITQKQLAEYGYDCPQTGELDAQTRQVILAFQRHFYPKRLTGVWDRECRAVLAGLLTIV